MYIAPQFQLLPVGDFQIVFLTYRAVFGHTFMQVFGLKEGIRLCKHFFPYHETKSKIQTRLKMSFMIHAPSKLMQKINNFSCFSCRLFMVWELRLLLPSLLCTPRIAGLQNPRLVKEISPNRGSSCVESINDDETMSYWDEILVCRIEAYVLKCNRKYICSPKSPEYFHFFVNLTLYSAWFQGVLATYLPPSFFC